MDSQHLYGETVAWDSYDDINSNFFGVYSLFRTALATNNNYLLWGELRNGDFLSSARADLKAVIEGQLNTQFPILEEMKDWRRFYAVINAINLYIERSGEAMVDTRYTRVMNNLDIAHMRCLRAWAYFMMVRIWGDVPFLTSSFDGAFPQVPRTDQRKILEFCEAEVLKAVDFLPYIYGGSDPLQTGNFHLQTSDQYRTMLFGRLAAYGLLAHIAAWQGHYADAEVYAQFVIDRRSSGQLDYATTGQLTASNGVFYDRGAENGGPRVLMGFPLSWQFGESGTSGDGHIESWTMAAPFTSKSIPDLYVPADLITAVFTSPTDQRFRFDTVRTSVVDSTLRIVTAGEYFKNFFSSTPIFSKIKVFNNGRSNADGSVNFAVYSSNITFSRLDEMRLLKAEASAAIGNTNGAIAALNEQLISRGANTYSATKDGDLLEAIFKERRRELIGEAWRWYDQVRYYKLRRNNAGFNKLIDEGGIYCPVSKAVLASNPSIQQYPYWTNK
ncbi:RagB/SusD family nutrient uptake outer membrane protein [Niabella sp.]|uniref:RagB/SusD family nutrient uptake outer membrane protein n=1 Tax=Niabella sp. TaxID=1962976 RepID=UPI00261A0F9B|nr:RagB/SusD family nutrient uptake outer membrane protein [Niabella sp.]